MVVVARNWCAARFPRRERECFFFGTGPPGIAVQSFRALLLDMPYSGSPVERFAVKVFLVLTQLHCFDGWHGVQERPPSAVSLIVDARAGLVVAVDAAARADTRALRTAEWTAWAGRAKCTGGRSRSGRGRCPRRLRGFSTGSTSSRSRMPLMRDRDRGIASSSMVISTACI